MKQILTQHTGTAMRIATTLGLGVVITAVIATTQPAAFGQPSIEAANAQQPSTSWPLFVFDNGLGRDQGWKPDRQAELTARLGYSGIGYTHVKELKERYAACELTGQRIFSFYVPFHVSASQPVATETLQKLPQLKGKQAILWIHTHGKASKTEAVHAFRKFADQAAKYDVQVVIYPHAHFYVETADHALELAKAVNRQNFGMSINVCHELKAGNGEELVRLASESVDHLFLVSINGANHIEHPEDERDWSRLIQPLGKGDFDLKPFIKKLHERGYQGPIGLQCYLVPGKPEKVLRESMAAWRTLVQDTLVQDIEAN